MSPRGFHKCRASWRFLGLVGGLYAAIGAVWFLFVPHSRSIFRDLVLIPVVVALGAVL
jgi:hypothetical protein